MEDSEDMDEDETQDDEQNLQHIVKEVVKNKMAIQEETVTRLEKGAWSSTSEIDKQHARPNKTNLKTIKRTHVQFQEGRQHGERKSKK